MRREARAELLQQQVADVVAEGVVDLLEAVEVDEQQAGRAARRDVGVEPAGERAAVRQAGELVGQRLAAGLAELADLAEGHRRAARRASTIAAVARTTAIWCSLAERRRREHADGDERRDRGDGERAPFADAGVARRERLPARRAR